MNQQPKILTVSKPIPENYSPKNILMIRLHAVGDTAITLPYCCALKKMYTETNIDYLTSPNSKLLPSSLSIFRTTYNIDLTYSNTNSLTSKIKRYLKAINIGWKLRKKNYDVVLDLQNNNISNVIRKIINPEYYSEFDKFSFLSANTRTLNTFISAGFNIKP